MATLVFVLNGHEVSTEYEEGQHFLEVLRENLGITTVKDGCSPQGVCGCCTILLDDKPALACLLDPIQVAGREVTTLEGLPEHQRQLLAETFVREGAVQCGFCTPGIAVRAAHLINRGLTDDRERVQKALAGHICRCTGYHRIVDAIQLAGSGSTLPAVAPEHGIGGASPRYLGHDQVLGTKTFVADMTVDGMLHGFLVLADHPRARVLGIDTRSAEAAPGVKRVLTANDIPGVRRHGLILNDWPVMVAPGETTRYIGDVLAVVVADTRHHARRAAERGRCPGRGARSGHRSGARAREGTRRRSTTAAISSRSAHSRAAMSTGRWRTPPTRLRPSSGPSGSSTPSSNPSRVSPSP